jgi:type VI protein secretion system component VasK
MPPGLYHERRTGVAFLSLVAATNVIPWMELLLGQTAAEEPLAPSQIRAAIGTCVLALVFLLCAWFSGRRNPASEKARITEPRRAGLRFALAAAAGNLILAGVIRWFGARRSLDFPQELPIFACIWYLVILPTGLVAGFSLGRAGRMPWRRPEGDD